MAADDPIGPSSQNCQERDALDNLNLYLKPWRLQLVDQRNDFGRDAFVQIFINEDGRNRTHPSTFIIQCKSSAKALNEIHSDSVETRHLSLWTAPGSSPVFLVMWSAATNEFRFRSAKSMREELDRTNPDWRNRAEVTVHYRKQDGYASSELARNAILRQLTDELDYRGGIETFHRAKRRIVLTNIFFPGTMTTSSSIGLSSEQTIHFGEGWINGDISLSDAEGDQVFASSFLLFEEVWAPLNSIPVFFRLLGESITLDLLERQRLKIYTTKDHFGFLVEKGSLSGRLSNFTLGSGDSIELLQNMLKEQTDARTIRRLREYVTMPENVGASLVVAYTQEDLKRPGFRELLGLRPFISDEEPIWDAPLVNRLATVNLVRAIGTSIRADVIQYEGGLSRLASEKDYDLFGLNRLFDNVKAFDAVLRASGMPYLGQLVKQITLRDLVLLSDSNSAQSFRDWFWSSAAGLVGRGVNITKDFLGEVETLVKKSVQPKEFHRTLKMRYIESFQGELVPLDLLSDVRPAFATTVANGQEVILRQRSNFSKHRKKQVGILTGVSDPYAPCPCRSGAKFRFCCGS